MTLLTRIKVLGGHAYKCDYCESEDGRKTLRWKKKNFDLCLSCLDELFMCYLAPEYKKNEKLVVRRKTIPEELRDKILEKYDHKCANCKTDLHLQIDHIIPFSIGGKTIEENLQVLCGFCNQSKNNRV